MSKAMIVMILFSMNAWADVDPAISDHLSLQFGQADSIAQLVVANASDLHGDDGSGVEFTQFFVGVAPSATFGISSVLSLQVAPEITFIFEKTELPN